MMKSMSTLIAVVAAGTLSASALGQATIDSSYRLVRGSSSYADEHTNSSFSDELDTVAPGHFDYFVGSDPTDPIASMSSVVEPEIIEGALYANGRSWSQGCQCAVGWVALSTMEVQFTVPDGMPYRLDYTYDSRNSDSQLVLSSLTHEVIGFTPVNFSDTGSLEGTFRQGTYTLIASTVPGDDSGGGFVVRTSSSIEFTLTIGNPPPVCGGDLNVDGIVDTADLGGLIGVFGASVFPYAYGDINGDGSVDTADLGILIANLGLCTD